MTAVDHTTTASPTVLDRWLARSGLAPWTVPVGLAGFLAFMAALALLGVDPYHRGPAPSPRAVVDPPGLWVFNLVIPAAATLFLIWASVRCHRGGTLTWWWLFFIGGVACFWAETVGDWAFYLSYSPNFWHYTLPFTFPWHVQENPYFMPFAYGVYWGLHAWAIIKIVRWWSHRSGWSELKSLMLFAAPLGYAWDFFVEGSATYFGWWQYQPPLGPALDWSSLGGRGSMPFLVPIVIMIGWPNLIAWFAGDPATGKPGRIEQLFNLHQLLPPDHPHHLALQQPITLEPAKLDSSAVARLQWIWRYELARAGAWVLTFWVSFTVLLLVPLIALRYLFGHDSIFAPSPG